jgi:hypothetical protein
LRPKRRALDICVIEGDHGVWVTGQEVSMANRTFHFRLRYVVTKDGRDFEDGNIGKSHLSEDGLHLMLSQAAAVGKAVEAAAHKGGRLRVLLSCECVALDGGDIPVGSNYSGHFGGIDQADYPEIMSTLLASGHTLLHAAKQAAAAKK